MNNCTIITEAIDKEEAANVTVLSPNFSVMTPPIIGPAMIPREKAKPSLPKASALPENINLNLQMKINHYLNEFGKCFMSFIIY